jgi:hypothetical protein
MYVTALTKYLQLPFNLTTTNRTILFREIIIVYSEDHIKPISFLNAKACSAAVL